MPLMINRRIFTQGSLGLAASFGLPSMASAKNVCVAGVWGGDYQQLMDKLVARPLTKTTDAEVQWDIGLHDARKAKLLSERRLPTGTLDVVALQDEDMYDMSLAQVLEGVDEASVPNLAHLLPGFATGYSVPHLYSGLVIAYNPKYLKPKSLADLWDSKLDGKVGLPSALEARMIAMATLAAGMPLESFEPGKQKLLELKKLNPRVYPSNEAIAQALQSGEIWATPIWRARAVQWQDAGVPITNVVPAEGIMPITFEVAIPKNAPNKAAARAFVNAVLSPEAEAGFAEGMGYSSVVDNVQLPAELSARIGFTPEEQAQIVPLDREYLSRESDQLKEWWDREFLS